MTKAPESGHHGDLTAGITLVMAATLSVLAMAHHPTSAQTGGLTAYVHGTMIALMAALFYGFAHFALRRALEHPVILAGLVAYGISLGANLGAGTINGFVVPALADQAQTADGHAILALCWEINQALANLGVFATGTAFALWSVDFLRRNGLDNRMIGAFGLMAGIVPALALAAGRLEMNVAGAFTIYAAHGLFAVLVGIQMIRHRI